MSAKRNLLNNCAAIVLAHNEDQARPLLRLCENMGFGRGFFFTGQLDPSIARIKVIYVFFHFALSDATKLAALRAMRALPDDRIRLAPMIVISKTADYETCRGYVKMGFDDIFTIPGKPDALAEKLLVQLERGHLYLETADYFGPDRRRMDLPGTDHVKRKSAVHRHAKMTIYRNPAEGARIILRQDFWNSELLRSTGSPIPTFMPMPEAVFNKSKSWVEFMR